MEVSDLTDRLRRRTEENERLRDQLRSTSSELSFLETRLSGSRANTSELEGKLHAQTLQTTKLARESELLNNHVKSLESSLSQSRKDLNEARKRYSDAILEKDWALSSVSMELENSRLRVALLEDKVGLQDERINSFLDQISSLELASAAKITEHQTELDKKNAVVDLCKQSYDEAMAKMEELEKRGSSYRDSCTNQLVELQSALQEHQSEDRKISEEREKSVLLSRVAELENQLSEARGAFPASKSDSDIATATATAAAAAAANVIALPTEIEGALDPSTLYNRTVRAEREIAVERVRRVEAEQYLEHILKNVERKAPIIANQRREHIRIKELYEKVTRQLDAVLADCSRLREVLQKSETAGRTATAQVASLSLQNQDLSSQVKHLLKQSVNQGDAAMDDESNDPDTISKYLVTFKSVEELHDKNLKLLEVVRRLSLHHSEEPSETLTLSATTGALDISISLSEALSELGKMQCARQAAQDMVTDLMAQRDFYKVLAEGAGLAASPSKAVAYSERGQMIVSTTGALLPFSPHAARVVELEEERTLLLASKNKAEKSLELLTAKLESEKAEASNIRLQLVNSTNNLRKIQEQLHQKDEQYQRLEVNTKSCIQRFSDMEKKLLEVQSAKLLQEKKLEDLQCMHQMSEDLKLRAEMELSLCKSNESALMEQVKTLDEESKRESSILESAGIFESSLSKRLTEEVSNVAHERDSLTLEVESLQKQLHDRSLVVDQRISLCENELKSCRADVEQKSSEVAQVRLLLVQEQNTAKVASEKCCFLERQLAIFYERRSSAASNGDLGEDATGLQNLLEENTSTISSLKSQLQAAESHTEQFRKIATESESALQNLQKYVIDTKEAYESELQRLLSELQEVSCDFSTYRSTNADALKDLEHLRIDLQETKLKLETVTNDLAGAQRTSKHSWDQSLQREEDLKAEVWRLQQTAKAVFLNYEREKELHLKSESERDELQIKLTSIQSALTGAEQKVTELSSDLICRDRSLQQERSKAAKDAKEKESKLEGLQRSRDLLLTQLQGLDTKLLKLEEGGGYAEIADTDVRSRRGIAGGSTSDADQELKDLRRGSVELREVLYFIKRERDVMEAKLTVTEAESARHQATLSATQRALEETRSMLKRESEKLTPMRDESQFEQLMQQVSKLNQTTELNNTLRKENSDLLARLALLQNQMSRKHASTSWASGTAQNQQINESLMSDKAALEAENAQLLADATLWKGRLEHLLARYRDVDPEDHRALQVNFSSATTEIAVKSAVIVTKEEEIDRLQKSFESAEKQANGLRNKLREWKKQIEDLASRNAEAEKEVSSGKELVVELSRKIAEQNEIIERTQINLVSVSVPGDTDGNQEAEVEVTSSDSTGATATAAADLSAVSKKRPAPDTANLLSTTEETNQAALRDAQAAKLKEMMLTSKNRSDSLSRTPVAPGGATVSVSASDPGENPPSKKVKTVAAKTQAKKIFAKLPLNPAAAPFLFGAAAPATATATATATTTNTTTGVADA